MKTGHDLDNSFISMLRLDDSLIPFSRTERFQSLTVNLVRQGIYWLDNWPAGLKLNTELSHFLFHILTGLLGIWEGTLPQSFYSILPLTLAFSLAIIDRLAIHLPTVIGLLGLSGLLGMTMILSISSDIFRYLTVHLNVTYSLIRMAYKSQLTTTASLFNLFRG